MVSIKIKETTHEILKKAQSLKACPDMDSLLLKMSAVVLKVWDPALYQGYSKNIDENSRFIPAHLKAYVWKRDKGFCTNCMSTFGLEIDHIKPFSAGGKTTPENLRLLCKSCNQRRAITYFNKSIPVGLSLPS